MVGAQSCMIRRLINDVDFHMIIGMKGDLGPKGSTGSPGAKGERGMTGPAGRNATLAGGITYNRWGSAHCPTGAVLLYSGRMGSTYYSHQGGGANYLCMPDNPGFSSGYRSGTQGYSYMYGAEYESPLVTGSNSYLAACAVCYVPTKSTVIMMPANYLCPTGWTREYYGYLMSERYYSYYRTMFECLDASMDIIHGSSSSSGSHLYHVEASCSGMSCPPYDGYRELNCAVCSK